MCGRGKGWGRKGSQGVYLGYFLSNYYNGRVLYTVLRSTEVKDKFLVI